MVIESVEVRASLPVTYDSRLRLEVKDASHLPPGAPRDFDYQTNLSRKLTYVCIIKV